MIVFYKAHVRIFVNSNDIIMDNNRIMGGIYRTDGSDKLINASLKRLNYHVLLTYTSFFPASYFLHVGALAGQRSRLLLRRGCSCDWLCERMELHRWRIRC